MVNIRAYREAASMTQAELGRRVGVTPQAVTRWETGAAKPTLDNLFAMAAIFDCAVSDLYVPDPSPGAVPAQ